MLPWKGTLRSYSRTFEQITSLLTKSSEKEHVRELVEYKMQLAQKDFFYVLWGFHNAADEMRKVVLTQRDNEK